MTGAILELIAFDYSISLWKYSKLKHEYLVNGKRMLFFENTKETQEKSTKSKEKAKRKHLETRREYSFLKKFQVFLMVFNLILAIPVRHDLL